MSTQTRQMISTEIETYSGSYVDVFDPKPETISLEDIAHALAATARFGGHTRKFYSVAEHAVFVSRRVERKGGTREQQFLALHHDDAEAYLCDIPRPLKPLLGEAYEALSERMDAAIKEALNLPDTEERDNHDAILNNDSDAKVPIVKVADNFALFVEARDLLPSQGRKWQLKPDVRVVVPDYYLGGLPPREAEALYLERHDELAGA